MSFKVESFVPEAINAVGKGTENAMLETAIKVTTQAKLLAPVDTSQLKSSLMWKTEKADGLNTGGPKLTERVGKMAIIVGTAVLHGIYQEFGTRFMAAQSFLRVAIQMIVNGAGFAQAVAKTMADTVQEKLKNA